MGKSRKTWQRYFASQEKRRVRKRQRLYLRKQIRQRAECEAEQLRLKNRIIIRKIMDFIRGKYFKNYYETTG